MLRYAPLGRAVAFGLFAALYAVAAPAQQVGTYTGTTADGHTISITVGTDSGNGEFQITGMGIGFTYNCKKPDVHTEDLGIGWGPGQDFTGRSVPIVLNSSTDYVSGKITFTGTSAASGSFTSRAAFLVPGTTPPKLAQVCIAPNIKFTATFTSPTVVKPSGVTVSHLER